VARTVDTLPRMQTEAQEYLPLEEVPAGEPYRMRGVAPPADNLMDRCRHYCVGYFLGSLPHMKYALQGSLLAICFKQVGALKRRRFLRRAVDRSPRS
jgi:hypothetical protein